MSRGGHSTDSKRYYDWLFYAHNDRLASLLLANDKRLYGLCVFHCQQCIEKSLKAYLLFKSRKLLDGHNLTWLCKQAALMDGKFTVWLPAVTKLNRLYIETRYPADILLEIDRKTVDETMDASSEMLDFICEQIKFDYNSFHRQTKLK